MPWAPLLLTSLTPGTGEGQPYPGEKRTSQLCSTPSLSFTVDCCPAQTPLSLYSVCDLGRDDSIILSDQSPRLMAMFSYTGNSNIGEAWLQQHLSHILKLHFNRKNI